MNIVVGYEAAFGEPTRSVSTSEEHYQTVWGSAKSGLTPLLLLSKERTDWNITIEFVSDIKLNSLLWLRPANRFESRLTLRSSDGEQIPAASKDVLAAWNLPQPVRSEDITGAVHPRSSRGMQWLRWGNAGDRVPSASFGLESAFTLDSTNDLVLSVAPVLYEVDNNGVTAHLVEFSPMEVVLRSDGTIAGNCVERRVTMAVKEGLRPDLAITRCGSDWRFEIQFLSMTNSPYHTWLRITNHLGANLTLQSSSGTYWPRVSEEATQIAELPKSGSVSQLLSLTTELPGLLQWLSTDTGLATSTEFRLSDAFEGPFTNQFVIQIDPLLYKVGPDSTAHLVNFGLIKLRLDPRGTILPLDP